MNGYLYDPHTHTAETSRCAHMPAAETVDRYAAKGFSGLVVTDHLHPEYLSWVDQNHDWNQVMDLYLKGYKASKKRGDEIGFDVILGAEFRFPDNDNDYLVYGIDEHWLRSNPYACCMRAQEFFDKFHNEVLIIHAHPFRDGMAPVQERAIHGSEVINAHRRHDNHNDKAWELCMRHPEYYRLAGSDCHDPGDEAGAGVILPQRVHDSFAYKAAIERRDFQLWSPIFPEIVELDQKYRQDA